VETLEDPGGGTGTHATWQTVECLAGLLEFEGLDDTIPWTEHHFDAYVGVDTAPCTAAEPCRTLSRAKQLFGYGARIIWNSDHPFISNRIFPYTADLGECAVDEEVTYDGGTSRILDIASDVSHIVFETVSGHPIASDTDFTGIDTGCEWTTGQIIDAIWDGVPGSASVLPELDCPREYRDRICALMEASDPERPIVVNSDGSFLDDARKNAPFGTFGKEDDSGIGGFENMHCDNVLSDCFTQVGHGRIRVLNGKATRILNGGPESRNKNCFTTHGWIGSDGSPAGLDAVNGECEGFPFVSSAGAPIAPTAGTHGKGDSYLVMVGQGELVSNLSRAIESQSVLAGTGGDVYIVGHHLRCELGENPPAGACPAFFLQSRDGDVRVRLARVVLEGARSITGQTASLKLLARTGGAFDVQLLNTTLTNSSRERYGSCWRFTLGQNVGPHSIRFWDVLAEGCGNEAGRLTSGRLADLDFVATGIYDSDEGLWFAAGSARSLSWIQANTTWDFYSDPATSFDSGGVGVDGDQFGGDPLYRCLDEAKECHLGTDGNRSFEFPLPLADYLRVPIDGYVERGPRNIGAR
jgi:hypothetical protein